MTLKAQMSICTIIRVFAL